MSKSLHNWIIILLVFLVPFGAVAAYIFYQKTKDKVKAEDNTDLNGDGENDVYDIADDSKPEITEV